MANIDPIDQYFDLNKLNENAAKAIQTLDAVFEHIEKGFKKVNGMQIKIGGANSVSGFSALKTESQQVTKQMQEDAREYVATWKRLLKERDDAEKASIKAMEAERKKAVQAFAPDSNIALSKTLNDLRQGYDRLTKAERENAEIGGVLVARIKELDAALKATDASTGRFQRNVGNYSSATAGLNNNVRILASELPNAGISIRTFAQSLSNNIMPFLESIKQVKIENAALRAEGKQTTSVIKTLGASLMSTPVLIGVAVAAGLKLVEMLSKGSKAAQEAEKSLEKYNDALKSAEESERSAANQQIARLNVLTSLAQDNAQSTRARVAAVDELQKTYPSTFGALDKQAILEGRLGDAVNKTTQALLSRAAAQAAEKKFTAASENLYDINERRRKTQVELNKEIDKFNKLQSLAEKANATDELRTRWVRQGAVVNSLKKDLSDLENSYLAAGYEQRRYLNDAKKFAAEMGDTLLPKETPTAPTGGSKLGKVAAAEKDKYEAERIAIQAQKEIAQSEQRTFAEREEAARSFAILSQQLLEKQNKASTDNIILYATETDRLMTKINEDKEKKRQEDLQALEDASKKEYDIIVKNLNDIALQGKESGLNDPEILQNQLSYLSQSLRALGLQEEEIKKIQERITNTTIQLKEKEAQEIDKIERNRINIERKNQQHRKELERELFNFTMQMIEASSARKIKEFEDEIERTKIDADRKIEAINNSSRTQVEKEEMIKAVNAETAAQEQENNRKIAEEQRKQAILSKGIAIAGIAIKLAETIATINAAAAAYNLVIPGSGVAYAAIAIPTAIATAAAQTAAVVATPIPEYAKGKDPSDSYEGAMIWGEKGTEMKIDKDGKLSIATKPTLGYTEKGDRIISNKELMDGSFMKYVPSAADISFDQLITATANIYDSNTKKVVKAIKSLQQPRPLTMNEINANLAAKR